MAYAAVISLKLTIHRLLNSSHTCIDSTTSREILDVAYKQLTSLQETLRRSDDGNNSRARRRRLNTLHRQIRESAHQLQDSLESHASNQFLSNHEEEISSPLLPLELDLEEVWPEINSFVEAAKKMEEDYNRELANPNSLEEGDNDDHEDLAEIPSRAIDSAVKMIGFSNEFTDLKDHVIRTIRPEDYGVFSFYGGAGNGRSIVAKTVYEEIYVSKERSFDCGAWVRIGSTYQLKEILLTIIAQTNGVENHESLTSEGEEKLIKYLYESLEGRRYVVVLDDVRETEILSQLRRSLPEQNNGSMVFLTTSVIEVARFEESFFLYEISVVWDELLSWSYMRLVIMSGGWLISPEFEEAGVKIARNCRGFRVVLARVLVELLRSEKRLGFWKRLAEEEDDPIFIVDDEISEANQIQQRLREEDGFWANVMFDFSTLIQRIKENLYPERFFPKMGIMTVYGMAGVGKTTLVRNVFEDSSISHRFDHLVWINMGPEYQPEGILVDILAQTFPQIDKTTMKEDAKLVEDLCAQLPYQKLLIVLDDLWSQEPVQFLKGISPNIKGEIVITTRLLKLGFFGPCDRTYKLRLLNNEESWDLLRKKVFGEERFPSSLEPAGKKIAEICEGLPLLIVAVAEILSKSEKNLEYWKKVAEKKIPVVMNAQYEIAKGMLPIYESLPQHLKECFLYMGVFPQNHEIPTSTLMNIWYADGFLEPNSSRTVEEVAAQCLKELVGRTMVMVKKGSDLETSKTCNLHSVYWHLSCNAAMKNGFFHPLDTHVDKNSIGGIKNERRLCIRKGILFGIKDVYNAIVSASTSHALLCTGPPHRYPVPLYSGSRLLKVLEALSIRFYEFPIEVVKQIHLRYLSLTCDGELPASISKLWNLQFLIIKQYLSIKSSKSSSSYLPKEIWDMKDLKHLQVSGSKLPDPENEALLPNLSSLLDVSVHSCTLRVFERVPNLKKLGIQIELEPNDKSNPFDNLNHISCLLNLESLTCVVVNPDFGLGPPPLNSMLPSSLKKLCLSGIGYFWEHMRMIGKLPNLEVLKLRCYAFRGRVWEIDYGEFPQLKFLSIEDTDLVRWDFKVPSIYHLQHLSIKHCYNLEELPSSVPGRVVMLEVIDSHPLAVKWAKEMKEKNWEIRMMRTLELHVQSSWNDDN